VKDIHNDIYSAMKVQKSADHYYEAAEDEVDILETVSTKWKKEGWKMDVAEYYTGIKISGAPNAEQLEII
jgi:hypothetical protein